jgi:RecB family endonuclease NucS
MPIRHAIWKVGDQPQQLPESSLSDEQLLEKMIVADPKILSEEWMLIGRQEMTGHGGRIDLVALAPDASLVLIELKRDKTPREVVAQALDYAAWVEKLQSEEITASTVASLRHEVSTMTTRRVSGSLLTKKR